MRFASKNIDIHSGEIIRSLSSVNPPSPRLRRDRLRFTPIDSPLARPDVASLRGRVAKSGDEANLDALREPDVIIPFSPKTRETIYGKCAPLYEKGMSLREIERATGIPKSTIRETFKRKEKARRRFVRGNDPSIERPKGKPPGAAPYGYGWLEGQLVKDPKEYSVVLEIMKLWRGRKKYREIVRILNDRSIRTRFGKIWSHCVVRAIINREMV